LKEKSKKFFIFICLTLITFSLCSAESLEARGKGPEKDEVIALYPGATFIKKSTLKNKTVKKEYCSKDAIKFIKKYYKRKHPGAVELTMGTREGDIQKLLLDVKSPLERHKSRKSISFLTTQKRGKCRTIIWIQDLPKKKIEKIEKIEKKKKPKKAAGIKKKKEPFKEKKISRKILGIGAAVNAVNTSAGASLIIWPHANIGIQGNYGAGLFTSYEAKLFYRMNPDYPLKPYLGGGYLHVEKEDTILGREYSIEADSYSVFAGLEYDLGANFSFYLDIAGTPLKLEDEYIVGATKIVAQVDYSPVTVNLNMVYYLW